MRFHQWLKIVYGAIQCRQLCIVVFWNNYPVAFSQLHDNIQEIHRVHLDLVPDKYITLDITQVLIRYYVLNELQYHRFNFLPVQELFPSIMAELIAAWILCIYAQIDMRN